MARGPNYKVPRRRRREGKTNYYKRYIMALSGKPRLVLRGSLRHFICQVAEFDVIGDRITVAAHSKELVKYFGWKAPCGNLPAAYLTGLLCGLRAREKGYTYLVPDIGLHRPVKGARVFAAIKGAIDAGVEVPCDPEMFPSEDRIRGEHIARWARMLKEQSPEMYQRMFSQYIKAGLDPEELPQHFEMVKKLILEKYGRV